jgi:lipopolysaccharide transport system ATP-binding protein
MGHKRRDESSTATASQSAREIWALRDLDLEVMPGEVLGIVGRNGAGKSTLLKILSRITEPTTGRIELYGRVGSLLEVGTGFHPELTGRENIYLNGAILGMRRAEIDRKFDEIVAFAETEKFLDTPVKHYSSGMYVRLAFAVAAHLEPEILLVDEVLAVGDIAFQRKCLGKIGDVARSGRTVIFVSHNMASIESLCSWCILLAGGLLIAKEEPREIIVRYMTSELAAHTGVCSLRTHGGRTGASTSIMESVSMHSETVGAISVLPIGTPLSVKVSFSAPRAVRPILGVVFKTGAGMPVFAVSNRFTNQGQSDDPIRKGEISCNFDSLPLVPGTYVLSLYFGDFGDQTRDLDTVIDAITLEVPPSDVFGTGMLPRPSDGPVLWKASWSLTQATDTDH